MSEIAKILSFFKEIWDTKNKYLLIIVLIIYLAKNYFTEIIKEIGKLFSFESLIMNIIYSVYFVGVPVVLIYLYFYSNNKLLKAKKNTIGICIAIITETDEQYKQMESKFVNILKDVFVSEHYDNYSTVFINGKKVVKYSLNRDDHIEKFLIAIRCQYFINISCVDGYCNGEGIYSIKTFSGILNQKISNEIFQYISLDISEMVEHISNIKIYKKNDIDEFEARSYELTYVCEYIVGITLFLSKNFYAGIDMLEKLHIQISKNKQNDTAINVIKSKLPSRIYEFHYINYLALIREFLNNGRDENLIKAKQSLDKMNLLFPNTYAYYLSNAAYYFLNNRDIKNSKKSIEQAKKMAGVDKTWLYSEAFIVLYEGKSLLTAFRLYNKAIKNITDFQYVILFIQVVMVQDTSAKQLHLALAFLFFKLKNYDAAKYNLVKFSEWVELNENNAELNEYVIKLRKHIENSSIMKLS